jgi:hypothetical protein
MIALDDSVSVPDIARALEFTGLAISNTLQPGLFVIHPIQRRLPRNVIEFERPALIRPQG